MYLEPIDKNGIKTWYYDFTLKHKRHRGWLLPVENMNKRQAKTELEIIRANIIANNIAPTKRDIPSKGIFQRHEKYLKVHKAKTYDRIKYMFKKISFFNKFTVTTEREILRYQNMRMAEGVSGATINRELELARTAYNRAIKNKQSTFNPFANFDKFPEVERTRYLSKDELGRLLNAAKQLTDYKSPHLYEIVLTAIHTGMRSGEILNLHGGQIDFELGTITVKATGTNKYRKPKVIPVEPVLLEMYSRKLKQSQSGYVFENPSTGKPLGNIRKGFVSALEVAGIKDFRFHDLRHTFATYALLASQDIRAVQELLGHTDVRTTQRYTHVMSVQKSEVIAKTSNLITSLLDKKVDKSQLQSL
jgi:integrase